MQQYLVERTFASDANLDLPDPHDSPQRHLEFVGNNALDGVMWVHSYVSTDGRKSFCIYEAPSPEAIRRASSRNGLPVDRITEVYVLAAGIQLPQDKDFAGITQQSTDAITPKGEKSCG